MALGNGRLKKLDEVTTQIVPLKEVTYEQFKEFLNSLDEEKKTWSLDLQNLKNEKEFYGYHIDWTSAIVPLDNDKIIGLCNFYQCGQGNPYIEVSFVVKKEYQKQGIGLSMLYVIETIARRFKEKFKETPYKYMIGKHFKDNIASHKLFLKAGYKEWEKENENMEWKIKKIG